MHSWRDRLNKVTGQTRFAVCRIFVHLAGDEIAPLLGVLNQAAREAVDADGDLDVLEDGLADICQSLLRYDPYWRSAANEGNVFWDEGEAGDYVEELFTDSAQRYLTEPDLEEPIPDADELLSLPVTRNLVVMLTVAYEGEAPELETDLASASALHSALKAIISFRGREALRAIQVHFSPAQIGEDLSSDQLLYNFPELVPL
ncbi:DUF1517 domain-containing protein [Leptolyngbya sp. FACHB-261]|nr:DUF1517 domain-containing protein [Leptolyngbya sp. FACHB-261]